MAQAWQRGALVVDEMTGRLGRVMGCVGPYVQLRPVAGGREWDADPGRVREATPQERSMGRGAA